MKNLFISLITLNLTICAISQQNNQKQLPTKKSLEQLNSATETKPLTNSPIWYNKAAGDSIWSEDFNGDPGWSTGGAQDIWAFDTDGPNGQFSDPAVDIIESTTVSNGFMIYDADNNQTPDPAGGYFDHVGWLETPVIDFTGYTDLTLVFQHTYRSCCSQGFEPQVEVSDDGFATSEVYGAGMSGVGVNDAAPTSITKIDLSNFIANATNLANVQIRFLFDGSGGTSHYWWQLDDVGVVETYENDLALKDYYLASGALKIPYHYVPTNQLVDVEFSALIQNKGIDPQTGSILSVQTDDGINQNNFTSTGTTMNQGDTDSLVTSTNWLPSGAPGTVYDITLTAAQTETEQEPSDNLETEVFSITDSVYSIDNGALSGFISNFAGNATQAFKIGNNMEIMQDTYITSMSVFIQDDPDAISQEIYGEIHKFDGTDYLFEGSTNFQIIQSSDLGTLVTLTFPTPIQLNAGDNILLLAGHIGSQDSNINDVGFGMAQAVEQSVVVGAGSGGQFATLTSPNSIMVRANLDPNPTFDAPNVSNVIASDISNNGDGSDLELSFDTPNDESNIANYWIVATEAGVTPNAAADPLTFFQTEGKQITPDGTDHTVNFIAGDEYFYLDNGTLTPELIVEDTTMEVWVYVEGQNGFNDVYAASNPVTLQSDAPNVSNIVASDISDNGDGTDLQVTFDVPNDESYIANYWVVVTDTGVTPNAAANPLTFFQTEGKQITPDGTSHTVNFNAGDTYFYLDNSNLTPEIIVEDTIMEVWVYVEGQNGATDVFKSSNNITLTSSNVGINGQEITAVKAFPNPAKDKIFFEVPTTGGTLTITSIVGHKVISQPIENNIEIISTHALRNGVYIYSVHDNAGKLIKANKLVISK
jgi:hypothetical protein